MSWPLVKISEFCKTGSGGTPSRKVPEYFEGEIPWVKSGDLREKIVTEATEFISDLAVQKSSAKMVPQGAVLLAMYGATVGRMAMLGIDAATNQAVCSIVPDPMKAHPKYVYYALQAKVPVFLRNAVGGAQPNISQGMIKDTEIPLPPLAEQKRIAAILDKADGIRRKRQQAIQLADDFLRSVFLDLFGDPVTNPKGWEVKPLRELVSQKLQNGAYYPKGMYSDSGTEMVHMGDAFYDYVQRGSLKRVDASPADQEKYRLTAGDLLISRRSLNYEGAAKPSLIPQSDEPLLFESSLIRVTPCFKQLSLKFLYAYLAHPQVKTHKVRPFVTGATIKGISQKNLESVEVYVPPVEKQNEFVAIFERIEQLKESISTSTTGLNTLSASLSQKAFSGQL
ncbi:restriction endonuclease subunit S [Ferrimonas pelagia]|uniref:Restriction endonuclease subunit S n=1 Tax=Ferrimonas pelagia TaxID=1177826 RepID=A0ABP9EVM7_9GAMM